MILLIDLVLSLWIEQIWEKVLELQAVHQHLQFK